MIKLRNKIFKERITRNEIKCFSKNYKKLKKLHHYLFSKKRQIIFRFLDFFRFMLPTVLSVATMVGLYFLTDFISKSSKGINAEDLKNASDIIFTIIITVCPVLLLTIFISGLISHNEYFDKTEWFVFRCTKCLGEQSVSIVFIWDMIFVLLVILSKCFKGYVSVINCSIYVFLYTSLIMVKFIRFKRESEVDRYFFYLETTGAFSVTKRTSEISDYIEFKNMIEKEKEITFVDYFKSVLLNNASFIHGFNSLNKKLVEKAMKGEEIKKEQNIVEKYMLKFSLSCKTSAQIICLKIALNKYFETIKSLRKYSGTKQFELSVNEIVKMIGLCGSKRKNVLKNWKFEGFEPTNIVFLNKYHECFGMCSDIIACQNYLSFAYNSLLGDYESVTKNLKTKIIKENNMIIKDFEKEIETLSSLCESNKNSIKTVLKAKTQFVNSLAETITSEINASTLKNKGTK